MASCGVVEPSIETKRERENKNRASSIEIKEQIHDKLQYTLNIKNQEVWTAYLPRSLS